MADDTPTANGAGADELKVADDGLAVQDLSKLDLETVSPLTEEVMSRQATINIGASRVKLFIRHFLLLHRASPSSLHRASLTPL